MNKLKVKILQKNINLTNINIKINSTNVDYDLQGRTTESKLHQKPNKKCISNFCPCLNTIA
jgi:hypothetical protein